MTTDNEKCQKCGYPKYQHPLKEHLSEIEELVKTSGEDEFDATFYAWQDNRLSKRLNRNFIYWCENYMEVSHADTLTGWSSGWIKYRQDYFAWLRGSFVNPHSEGECRTFRKEAAARKGNFMRIGKRGIRSVHWQRKYGKCPGCLKMEKLTVGVCRRCYIAIVNRDKLHRKNKGKKRVIM